MGAAATTAEVFSALRAMAAAVSEASGEEGARRMVLGEFVKRFLQAPNDAEALKTYLRGDKAFAPPRAGNEILSYAPADIVQAVDTGEFCGGAGFGALLQPEQVARLEKDKALAVGIRNLDEGVDKRLWSAKELFGGVDKVLLSVGPPKGNAYHVTGEAATSSKQDRKGRSRTRSPRRA